MRIPQASDRVDVALLDRLVREHRDAAVGYATRILGDASLAEDAVQRALLQILVRVRAGDDQLLAANPRAVVLRGTRWAALKLADRHTSRDDAERRAAAEPLAGGDDHDWDRLEARMLVEELLPSLPQHYRDVLRLRYLEGRPDATAAADLAVTVKAYRRRLDRALVVARTAAMRIGVTSLGAGLAALLRRVRQRGQQVLIGSDHTRWSPVSSGPAPGRASAGHIILAVATVGLIVGTPIAISGGRWAPPTTGGYPLGGGPADASGPSSAGRVIGPLAVGSTVRAAQTQQRPGASHWQDPLAHDDIMRLVPAPHEVENHTVLAEATDRECRCDVVLQSTDGGASWTAYPHPLGEHPVLPPDYPRDPRIFWIYNGVTTGTLICVEQRISDGTCTVDPRIPNSYPLVLDPAFDAGSPLMFIGTLSGLVSFNYATGVTRILQTDIDGAPLFPLAAPGGIGEFAVYALNTGAATSQGVRATAQHPVASAPVMGRFHLVGCRRDGSCAALRESSGLSLGVISSRDPAASGVTLVDEGRSGDLTTDAGASLREIPLSDFLIDIQVTGSGDQVHVAGIEAGRGDTYWIDLWSAQAGWTHVSLAGFSHSTNGFPLAAMSDGRLILGVGGASGGIRCSTDGGAHWADRCPPA
jgi:RNA polymerase sigma factor (sigma-70 family)